MTETSRGHCDRCGRTSRFGFPRCEGCGKELCELCRHADACEDDELPDPSDDEFDGEDYL